MIVTSGDMEREGESIDDVLIRNKNTQGIL